MYAGVQIRWEGRKESRTEEWWEMQNGVFGQEEEGCTDK